MSPSLTRRRGELGMNMGKGGELRIGDRDQLQLRL